MFSLIITIISIALVAALALATLYYGGKAFNKGSASADATKMLTQAQQLQGAAELYRADTGAYPLTMDDLLTNKYLTSVPMASLTPESAPALMGTANAASTPWVMVLSGYPVFAVTPVSEAVCKSINLKAYGPRRHPEDRAHLLCEPVLRPGHGPPHHGHLKNGCHAHHGSGQPFSCDCIGVRN
jgi:type II secretory pathway pseudopilin PulG